MSLSELPFFPRMIIGCMVVNCMDEFVDDEPVEVIKRSDEYDSLCHNTRDNEQNSTRRLLLAQQQDILQSTYRVNRNNFYLTGDINEKNGEKVINLMEQSSELKYNNKNIQTNVNTNLELNIQKKLQMDSKNDSILPLTQIELLLQDFIKKHNVKNVHSQRVQIIDAITGSVSTWEFYISDDMQNLILCSVNSSRQQVNEIPLKSINALVTNFSKNSQDKHESTLYKTLPKCCNNDVYLCFNSREVLKQSKILCASAFRDSLLLRFSSVQQHESFVLAIKILSAYVSV